MGSYIRQDDLPAMVRALAGQKNIEVSFNGRCSIAVELDKNGKRRMNLPPIPTNPTLSDVTQIIGNADHETAHALYTDFTIHMKSGILGTLVNIIEDARIEAKLGRNYPGSKQNLAKSANDYVASPRGRAHIAALLKSANPAKILPYWIDASLRTIADQGPNIKKVVRTLRGQLDQMGLGSLCESITDAVRGAHDLSSTQEAIDMAEKVMELIRQHNDQPRQGRGQGQPQPKSGEQSEGDDANGESEGDDANGESEGDDANGESEGDENQGSVHINTEIKSEEISALVNEATKAIADKAEMVYQDPSGSWAEDNIVANPSARAAAHQKALPIVASLVAKMQSAFESSRRVRWASSEDGRINPRRLAMAGAGLDPTPFRTRKTQAARVNTCVSCWLDASGSMYRCNRMLPAITAFIALAEACQRMNVALSLHAWYQSIVVGRAGAYQTYKEVSFNAPALKGWSQPWGQSSFDEACCCISGDRLTPTYQAILASMEDVKRRPEEKKIILFLTDGHPCSVQGDVIFTIEKSRMIIDKSRALATKAAEMASEQYVFVPIGIQDTIESWFPGGQRVDDLSKLPDVLLKAIKQ